MTDSLPEALAACTAQPLPYALLADRDDGTVVRCGEVVAKAHAGDADHEALAVRLRIAGHQALGGVLLPPLLPVPGRVQDRPVSLWPYGAPVDPQRPEEAPWEATAALLAALHRTPLAALPGPLPPMRGPAKLARALDRLGRAEKLPAGPDQGEVRSVRAAAATLPAWARGEAQAPPGGTLCHGDLHLGQLVRYPAPQGPWFLIDVDDLGLGTPTWDLGRPAAWFAAGLLDPGAWQRFLDAYRAAGGPAAGPPDTDPWPELDLAARALTVQTAALALAKAAEGRRRLDEGERLMVDACGRIAALPADLERELPS
ncbi:phosphotransferase family protein [Streptomyces sp. NPDC059447]|uniref:phosphotransferase family protein n=1 Tax=Streptomyces sp. NPDC059447 TaxID=3346834 RepID=UPI0036790F87